MIAVAVLMFFISACSDDDSSYRYPLKVGNTWTYERILDEEGKTTFIDTIRIEINSTVESPSGHICHELTITETHGEGRTGYQYVSNMTDGLYSLGGCYYNLFLKEGGRKVFRFPLFAAGAKAPKDGDEIRWYGEPHLILPKDPKTGNKWIQPENADWGEVHYEMQEMETVSTPLGDFKCHVKHSRVMDIVDLYDYYGSRGLIRFAYEYEYEVYDPELGEIVTMYAKEDIRLIDCDLK